MKKDNEEQGAGDNVICLKGVTRRPAMATDRYRNAMVAARLVDGMDPEEFMYFFFSLSQIRLPETSELVKHITPDVLGFLEEFHDAMVPEFPLQRPARQGSM